MVCGKYYCYLSYSDRIRLIFPPISFVIFLFTNFLAPPILSSPIRVYFDFSYKYHCTAHNSSVLFWTQNRLDQIKVIARAHPGHYFHRCIRKCTSDGIQLNLKIHKFLTKIFLHFNTL
jgi:hypothetical protein